MFAGPGSWQLGVDLEALPARRILILDGAIGTLLPDAVNKDALILTNPDIVSRVHEAYLEAGADIITTNTFRSTSLAQDAYGLASRVDDLNATAARLARAAADAWSRRTPDRPRFVAGSVGPLRGAFDAIHLAYREQMRGLIEGGVDLILAETIVGTAQAAAVTAAARDECDARGVEVPLMLSVTTDRGGRLPSGETLGAFYDAIRDARPFSVGLNCAFGARAMQPFLAELARVAHEYVSCHPNAGLPDASGAYDERPSETAARLREVAESGLVNIVGGCCGTTPDHIAAIAQAVANVTPRRRQRPTADR